MNRNFSISVGRLADLFHRESPLLQRHHGGPTSAPPPSKSPHHIPKAARANGYAVPIKAFTADRDTTFSGHNSFSDLESTRIDFEDSPPGGATNSSAKHNQTLESDNNSDIVIDEKKMVSAGSDFKIVFISSESKSGSELNSSLECAEAAEDGSPSQTTKTTSAADDLRHVTGDYIDEMDWVNYQKKVHPRGHHPAAGRRLSDSPRAAEANKRSPRILPDPDHRYVVCNFSNVVLVLSSKSRGCVTFFC